MPTDWQASSTELSNRSHWSDTCAVRKLLIIDDDREMADLLRESLAQEGFELSTVQSGEEGIERGRNTGLDLILLDVNLPGISEFELLRVLMESAGVPVGRQDLSKSVFDREYSVFDRSIDNLVSALRRKLGANSEGLE